MNTKPIQIAYAEDHPVYREALFEKLESEPDLTVLISAGSGRELIEGLEADPSPGVCILDISMPDINGFEAVSIIRKRWPGMKILVLSAYQKPGFLIRMVKMGINGYLKKSCSIKDLIEAIRTVSVAGFYASDVLSPRLLRQIQSGNYPYPILTAIEDRLLQLITTDLNYRQIGLEMKLSHKSIDNFRSHLFQKFNTNNRSNLVTKAIELGYMTIDRYSALY